MVILYFQLCVSAANAQTKKHDKTDEPSLGFVIRNLNNLLSEAQRAEGGKLRTNEVA